MCSPLETGGQWLAMVVRMPVEKGSEHKSNKMVYNFVKKNKEILSNDCLSTSSAADMFIYLFMI